MINKPTRLLQDIQAQPDSLAGILDYQAGEGRAALTEAAMLVRRGQRVVITGMGASLYASVSLEYCLCDQGIHAVSIEAAELLHYRLDMCRDAVVIMVSRSGDSIEIARLAESLRGRSPIIGITNEPAGALARAANCCLHIHSMADATVALQTYTGTVLTLMLLGGTARGEFDRVGSEADILIAAMRKLIQTGTETLRQWDSFVAGGLPLHLLGRGPSYGSALEGALLFNETPKANASAMPAGSFRHGPVEAVDSGFRTFVFAPQSRTRDLNLGLARDLCRFGAAVRVIGPAGPDTAGLSLCETPTASEALAPLVEIVPVQFAAFRLAELKGIPIGGLRYTPLVTRNEGTFAN